MVLVAPVILVVVILVIALVAFKQMARRTTEREERASSPAAESLHYRVPEGQDPVAVLIALHHAGFDAVEDHRSAGNDLLIPCPTGRDRERARVREVIAQTATLNLEGDPSGQAPVRFADE